MRAVVTVCMDADRVDGGIEIAELIRQVRGELSLAMWSGQQNEGPDQLKFELGEVELEIEFVVQKTRKPGAKAKLFVVDLEYGQEATASSTHRIRLALQPRLPGQPEQRPWISGPPLENEL